MATDEVYPWTAARRGETVTTEPSLELLTVDDVARLLKVSRNWVYERTRRRGTDRLPHFRIGKYLRFEETAVREFLDHQRRSS